MANTATKTKATAAERRRAMKEEDERRRRCIENALDNELTDEAREALADELDDIASDYREAVNYAIEEAECKMSYSLEELAKTWGWTLVDAAGEDAFIELDFDPATCAAQSTNSYHECDASYDADAEFHALRTHVEAANLRHPAKERDAA